jgi:hypothetical protein
LGQVVIMKLLSHATSVSLTALVLLFVSAPLALAQETVHLASVSGMVVDAQGAVMPGAMVTARQALGEPRSVQFAVRARF